LTGKRDAAHTGIRRLNNVLSGLRLHSLQILPQGVSNEREMGKRLDCTHTFRD
jgi:hypothetical protein